LAGDTIKNIANNKKAFHEYFVEESFECCIELAGTEVKSLRQGGASLKEAWCEIVEGEVFVKQMHIAPYDKGNIFNKDPLRPRKLLLHKSEIRKLIGQTKQQGFTLIPLSLYFKGSRVKLQMGLCRGKKLHDKRQDIAKRDAQRDIQRAMKERNR
jgi:SsrA-binding protein